ncbi:cysteine hydrolase [Paenibacillus sp. N3.4]|uniref:cysteine hydrolase n=1 Tax=Paenibacillus sp. N3.4 TaxID=2603222 RepID=UPI0011C78163|nr:cysteine hydrolase [Paenibacillus sp. N3.4]TXK71717.1 cysteine hydrolase [Paenibacillus sp. N3.4]
MNYRCPICGSWCKSYNYDYSGYWFQKNNLVGSNDRTIIDDWYNVSTPPAPELQAITIDPNISALLVLDMETTICKNHRCLASIAKINNLLTKAREMRMLVVYSLTHTGNLSDIFPQIAPIHGDPIVKSNVDKFYATNLYEILQDHGIKTVLITGYSANGAVLHTSTSAAFRGFEVIIPVDGMSAAIPYAEQYTAWHMLNSPGTRNNAVLTKTNLLSFASKI